MMATPYEGMFVFGSQDSRSRILTNLGFKLPAGLDKAIGDKFGANISKERTDLLDQDAIVWIVGDVAKDTAKLHKDASYGDLNVVKQGREVYIPRDRRLRQRDVFRLRPEPAVRRRAAGAAAGGGRRRQAGHEGGAARLLSPQARRETGQTSRKHRSLAASPLAARLLSVAVPQ